MHNQDILLEACRSFNLRPRNKFIDPLKSSISTTDLIGPTRSVEISLPANCQDPNWVYLSIVPGINEELIQNLDPNILAILNKKTPQGIQWLYRGQVVGGGMELRAQVSIDCPDFARAQLEHMYQVADELAQIIKYIRSTFKEKVDQM